MKLETAYKASDLIEKLTRLETSISDPILEIIYDTSDNNISYAEMRPEFAKKIEMLLKEEAEFLVKSISEL